MEQSVLYTPHQNGVTKRKNRSLKDMETCLLHANNLPHSLLEEAINYASNLQNRVTHKSVVGATPIETLHRNNPNVSHLRYFGSNSCALIPMDKINAFQA